MPLLKANDEGGITQLATMLLAGSAIAIGLITLGARWLIVKLIW